MPLLMIVIMILMFAFSGCYDTKTTVDVTAAETTAETAGTAETKAGSAKQDDLPADHDLLQREYRTKLKGNGDDIVTLMVYLCGSDLETQAGAATLDLIEMIKADVGDHINVIVETGGASAWATDVMDPNANQRWRVADNDLYLLESNKASNMSEGSTLRDFVTFSAENFPADRYMLLLWDHGGGTVDGFAYDERFHNDTMMSISELDQALSEAGVVFDMIGFDCCLMSTVETAFMVEKHADFMVASQRVEPGTGWHYTPWLEALAKNPSMPTPELGKVIIDSYIAEGRGGFSGSELTLSMTDLSYIPALFAELYQFLPEAELGMVEGDMFRTTSQVLSNSRAMQSSHDLVDLSYLVETMGGSENLLELMNQCVVYNGTTIENHNGLCMYIPYTDLDRVSEALSIYDGIGIDQPYQDFAIAFANMVLGGQVYSGGGSGSPFGNEFGLSGWSSLEWADEESWTGLADFYYENSYDSTSLYIEEKGDDFVLSLSDEDWEMITSANVRVFQDDGIEGYIDLGSDGVYEFDEDGDLIIQFDYYWVAINGELVCFYQAEEAEYDDYWYSYGVVPIYFEEEEAELVVVWDSDHPTGYVAGWRYTAMGGDTQKGLYEVYDGMKFDYLMDYYTYDGEYDDRYYFDGITVDGELTVEYVEVADDTGYWVCYELTDIYNNTYWTEFIWYGEWEEEQGSGYTTDIQGFLS